MIWKELLLEIYYAWTLQLDSWWICIAFRNCEDLNHTVLFDPASTSLTLSAVSFWPKNYTLFLGIRQNFLSPCLLLAQNNSMAVSICNPNLLYSFTGSSIYFRHLFPFSNNESLFLSWGFQMMYLSFFGSTNSKLAGCQSKKCKKGIWKIFISLNKSQ